MHGAIARSFEQQVHHLADLSNPNLEQLKDWLQHTPDQSLQYARWLRDIEDHRIGITTNATNYASRLEVLRQASLDTDDPQFLEQFLNRTHRHQQQIEIWQRYLLSSQPLFQQMIDTVRGIVEIDAQARARQAEQKAQERYP